MAGQEKRHTQRFDSLNLLQYVAIDAHGEHLATGMGRTLNVSKGGILLETRARLEPGVLVSVAIGIEENLVSVVGRVMHCNAGEDGAFTSGIRFDNIDAQADAVLTAYLAAFEASQKQKKK